MLSGVFHAWERRLASVSTDRTVRPFEWGLEWVDGAGGTSSPGAHLEQWADQMVASSEQFFALPPCSDFTLDGEWLTYPSAVETPHVENNLVRARYLPDSSPAGRTRAVIVLPQWNADSDGHVGLCRLLNRFGISALRLSLPYHDRRMPPGFERADFMVSANVGRTLQANRQAVLDTRAAVHWLAEQGYERIGIVGTSLGSCIAFLTFVHEEKIRAAVYNHVSSYFGDVVWEGLTTAHVRRGLETVLTRDEVRRAWLAISPNSYVSKLVDDQRPRLMISARYDLSFTPELSRLLFQECERKGVKLDRAILRCGHYTLGRAPYKYYAGYLLVSYFHKHL